MRVETKRVLVASALVFGLAAAANAVAEMEPAEAPVAEASPTPPVGTAPEATPASMDETLPTPERESLEAPGDGGGSDGRVARSSFTSDVVDREPQGEIDSLGNDSTQIYYFTELRGLDGDQVIHRWEYQGNVMAEVEFRVGADRWRVYSSKKLDPAWLGAWTVTVVDGGGRELSSESFEYVDGGVATSEAAAPAAAAPVTP